jgi:hypothetical protein
MMLYTSIVDKKIKYSPDETIVRTAPLGASRRSNCADPRLHEKLSGKTAMGDGTLKICLDAEPKVKGANRRSSQVKETGDMWVRKPAYPF